MLRGRKTKALLRAWVSGPVLLASYWAWASARKVALLARVPGLGHTSVVSRE